MTWRAVVAAFRGLRHAPRLAIAAVLCAALGVAATTAVSAFLSAVLLRELPFPESDRLVRVWTANDRAGDPQGELSIPELIEIERTVRSFDAFLGTARSRIVALLPQGAERLRGEGVTRAYFGALGLTPLRGRLIGPQDFVDGAPPAVVISAATWRRHFGGSPEAIGAPLRTTAGITFTVVGIAPEGFQGTVEPDVIEYWLPLPQYLPASARDDRTSRASYAIGRLAPGATMTQATDELSSIYRGLAGAHPAIYRDLRPRVEPMGENWRGQFRGAGIVLFAVSLAMLLIAALNVAGLLTARALDRRRELAVCAAMGASRGDLIAQLGGEALMLATLGGAIGAALAQPILTVILQTSPIELPAYVAVTFDARTLIAAISGIVLAGLVAGLAPALLAGRVEPADVLRGASRGAMQSRREQRWAPTLVAVEVALALALVVGGAVLLASYRNLSSFDPGHRIAGVARLAVTVSRQDVTDDAALPAFYERVRQSLQQQPGVERVGLVAPTLPPWDADRRRVRFARLPESQQAEGLDVGFHVIDPGTLPLLNINLLAGRGVESIDGPASEPVAVISRTLAERMGGPAAALGQTIALAADPRMAAMIPAASLRVVGVVADVAWDGMGQQGTDRYIAYGDPNDPLSHRDDLFVPLARFPSRIVSIAATTSGDEAQLIEPLRRRIAAIAPGSAVHWTGTMQDEFAFEFAAARFYAVLVGVFSSVSLALTAIGLFAMLSHAVARRRAEIGLRRALGGSRGHIVGQVLRLAMKPLVAGAIGGLAGAIFVTRAASSLLYGVQPFDVRVFLAGLAVLAVAAVLAAVVPAHRASTIDPMTALKGD